MKPGIQTTEFWLSLIAGAWSAVQPVANPTLQAVVPAVIAVGYAISRGLAKQQLPVK